MASAVGTDQPAVDALTAKYFADRSPPKAKRAAPTEKLAPPTLDDRDLLERAFAAANGAKFKRLWSGDTTGYGSASEADAALCGMLAFWTGPYPDRIDSLFRSSGLNRDKWEQREDYRTSTIAKGLEGRTEFFGDRPRPMPAVAVTPTNALEVATRIIQMDDCPLVAATEQPGKVTLERADGLRLAAKSLDALATFGKLSGALAAQFGHSLVIKQNDQRATAHAFVGALRRYFGVAPVDADEQLFEGWLVELVEEAGEIPFGNAEEKLAVWRHLRSQDPEAQKGAHAFAAAVLLAVDTTTGDRYIRGSWLQEYVRRSGWKGSTAEATGKFQAIGLVRPNPKSDGRVTAVWRAGGATIPLRFWIIPEGRIETWRS